MVRTTSRPQVRLIDFYETNNTALTDIARHLQNNLPYTYADHYLPHDVEIRELTTARSRKETLESLGLKPITVTPRHNVSDGIEAVRQMIPRCVFDAQKCEQGLEALRQYQREWDDKAKTFRQRPRHDWTSHASDAFRYLAMSLVAPKIARERRKPRRVGMA